MAYGETKIYFDGSHYIAIPHTTRILKKRPKPKEEVIIVVEEEQNSVISNSETAPVVHIQDNIAINNSTEESTHETDLHAANPPCTLKTEYKTTRKELFNKMYADNMNLSRVQRRNFILAQMRPYFKSQSAAEHYVDMQMERKMRNLITRRVRCIRKANLQQFNYFVTFTYDGKLHTECSFKKQLRNCLRNYSNRKGWRYLGVWERSPEKKRLHFHGLFYIPDGTMPGIMMEVNDYNFNTRKRQITHQNTYFNERFGRSSFEPVEDKNKFGEAIAYILKYIEKTGERIVYSKDLPQYFISDILDDDIVCPIGLEDKKLLLFDDFKCWDEGTFMGRVSRDTIKSMRKSN